MSMRMTFSRKYSPHGSGRTRRILEAHVGRGQHAGVDADGMPPLRVA